MNLKRFNLLVVVGWAVALGTSALGMAATIPTMGTAADFAVLGASTVTNTGATVVNGDLGVWPGLAITGFPPGIVNGTTHTGDAVAQQAQSDLTTAYNELAGQACDTDLTGQDLGGMTLTPGAYCFSTSAQLTGTLTLDALGSPSAVWVFQIGSTLTTASNAVVDVINGGSDCNVFWQVGSSATLGTGTSLAGSILALTSITLNTGANVSGQLLARNGAVTLDTNTVTLCIAVFPTITVNKDFVPNSPASVPVALTCTSGVVTTSPLNAAEGAPAVFTVTGAGPGTTCTATETVPAGYTADETDCAGVALDGTCTIVNTLNSNTITVLKDFLPNSAASVSVALTCSSGVVTTTPLNAAEGAPAVFTVTGAPPGTTCMATETIPAGYSADQTNCASVALNGTCTIVNTLNSSTITVIKDFLPNSPASVPVALTCNSGTVTTTPLNAAEGAPAVFTVTGATPGTTCMATETIPAGYTADQTNCASVALNGTCIIVNTLNSNTITVIKDFLPNSPATVPVALTCSSGTVTTTPLNAAEGAPAVFTVTGAAPGTICVATETIPPGYTADQTNCASVALGGSCTIVNTLATPPTDIPTLSGWGMAALVALLAMAGFIALRRSTL